MVFVLRLEKAEPALGWKTKGMKRSHCIRRTVASRMDAIGWTLEEIFNCLQKMKRILK